MEDRTKEEKNCRQEWDYDTERLWETLIRFQDHVFRTAKNLEFTYTIKGNEMFVSRKDKSITRSTVNLAFGKALELQRELGMVSGPKKLGCFGASYLYPIFVELGIICRPQPEI